MIGTAASAGSRGMVCCALPRLTALSLLICLFSAPTSADEWKGRVGGAYLWQSYSGSQNSFRTQYDLGDGFYLEDLDLSFAGESGIERFRIEATGFGGAQPTETARADLRLRSGVRFKLDYDRRQSFFNLASTGGELRSDDWDITRWKAMVEVDSWKSLRASVTLRRHETDGTMQRPLFGLNEFFPAGVALDETMTEGSFRLETRTLPVQILFEQSFTRYERQNRAFPVDENPLNPLNPNLLADTTTDFDVEQDVPTSLLSVSYADETFEGLVTMLYSDIELDSQGVGANTFALDGGNIGFLSFVDELIGTAQTDSLYGTLNLGFLLSPSWTLRTTGEFRDATTDTGLIGRRLFRGWNPPANPLDISFPVNETGRYDFEDAALRLRLEYRHSDWSVWGGALAASRDVIWRRTSTSETVESHRNSDGFLVGGAWDPSGPVDLNLEYERGAFTRYVYRVDPQTIDRVTLRLRSKLGSGWHLSAHGRYEDATNPADAASLDFRSSPYGVAATWSAESGVSLFGIDLERTDLSTETGLVLPGGQPGLSMFDVDAVSATIHGQTRAGKVGVGGSATYLKDDGSTWPLDSKNLIARVSYQGSHGIEYAAFSEFWSYDEKNSDLDDYEVTRFGLSLTWSF